MPSRSDAAASVADSDAAVHLLRAALSSPATAPVILIDGRSGAGKTTLAERIRADWPDGRLQRVALDWLYPGWDGLAAGVQQAYEKILLAHAAGHPGIGQRWDWNLGRSGEEFTIDPDRPVLLEGCGILTPETVVLADLTVWMEAPAEVRKVRALDRDGEGYRPHWDRWAAQEEDHISRNDPQGLADIVIAVA